MKGFIKKILRNSLISFTIIFTIVTIIMIIINTTTYYMLFNKVIVPIMEGEENELIIQMKESVKNADVRNIYNLDENAPIEVFLSAESSMRMLGYMLEQSLSILGISAILGLSIGVITSLSNKSKVKELFAFIVVGLVFFLVMTIITMIEYGQYAIENFASVLIDDVILQYGILYIIIYTIFFIIKYIVVKNKAKKLNEELKIK